MAPSQTRDNIENLSAVANQRINVGCHANASVQPCNRGSACAMTNLAFYEARPELYICAWGLGAANLTT